MIWKFCKEGGLRALEFDINVTLQDINVIQMFNVQLNMFKQISYRL